MEWDKTEFPTKIFKLMGRLNIKLQFPLLTMYREKNLCEFPDSSLGKDMVQTGMTISPIRLDISQFCSPRGFLNSILNSD